MTMRLSGKRALVTCAEQYMGPAIIHAFQDEGAELIISKKTLLDQKSVDELVEGAGRVDILVANFAEPPRTSPVENIVDADWMILFDKLVHPLMRIIRSVVPQMKSRNAGKIIAVTSAGPLRGIPNTTAYCAARGAQNAFIRAAGLELAKFNIQVNAIAQNYVRNNTYYPDEMVETERFQQHLNQFVPTKKVAEGFETAELALYLASERCTHMVGQIIPLAGGWTTTC
jgi:2-keto-3-deoxy-L-fuconate dehydrogenase